MPVYFGVVVLALGALLTAQLARRRVEPARTSWRRVSMLLAVLAVALAVYDLLRDLA